MGEAGARGTFEERVKLAKKKNKHIKKVHKRINANIVLPPDFIKLETVTSPDKTKSAVLLVDQKHNCTLDQMLFPCDMMIKDRQRCIRVFQTSLKIDGVI